MKKWVGPRSRPLAVKDPIDPFVPGPGFGKVIPFFFFFFFFFFSWVLIFYDHWIVYLLLKLVGQLEMYNEGEIVRCSDLMDPRSGRMSLLLRKFSNLMLRPTPSLQTLLEERLILTPLLKVPIILLALVFNSYVFIWLWDFVVVLKFSTHKVLIFFFCFFNFVFCLGQSRGICENFIWSQLLWSWSTLLYQ